MDPFAQTEDRFEEDLRIYFPTITEDIVHYISKVLYPPDYSGLQGYNSPTTRSALMITEGFFTCNTNWLGKALKYDTYNYIFSLWPSLHGDDIWYTYYNGPQPLVKDNALAVTMQRYFTSFAQTGSPNSFGVPYFPKYGRANICQNLNYIISPVRDNAATHRCDWWQLALFS